MWVNLCLLLVSCLAGISLCEVSLRFFSPKYRHLAEAKLRQDAGRIWARQANSRDSHGHPDTLVPHAFHHNNLALRQHRDFSEADLAAATNIGVFGDSFVENTRMDAPYSFTESLDYLLNQNGQRFNVLNFGVNGYETSQSLLHYKNFRFVNEMNYVFYVYCFNDIDGIYDKGLYHLDEAGHLERNERTRPWWVPLMNGLHLPYLILDARGHLSSYLEAMSIEEYWYVSYMKKRERMRARDGRVGHFLFRMQ